MTDVRSETLKRSPGMRFRLPAMIAAMTLLALLAALAGPYFRQQSAVAQRSLAAYWALAATLAIARGAWCWKRTMTPPPQMGAVHWRVTLVWRRAWPAPTIRLAILTAMALWLIFGTSHVSNIANRSPNGFLPPLLLGILNGTVMGFAFGSLLPLLPRQPAFICDRGVWSIHRQTVWSKLKSWQWKPDSTGVLQLTETHSTDLHGHLFLATPAKVRAAVEEFVRAKTELTIPDARARSAKADDVDQSDIESI